MFAKRLSILALGLSLPAASHALGIRLFDQDAFATARGDAFVATADNPSAIYYNPAGITQLQGHNVRGSVNLLDLGTTFETQSSREIDSDRNMITRPGLFYTYSPKKLPLTFGVGYYMPFGLSIEWPKDAPFRNIATRGEFLDHTLGGVVAWKITDTLSIGAGPAVSYAFTDLRRGIDPTSRSDEFRFKGKDISYGATAGLFWQPTKRHAFGISYRSPVTFDLEGESTFEPYALPKQDAEVRFPLPQVIIVGYSFRPTPKWNLEVNIDWTDWEVLNSPELKQNPPTTLVLQWENSFGIEAGVTRYFDNGLRVSAGYVFLENSVPDETLSPLLPDQDMHVFSVGVGGNIERWSWDCTYQFTYGVGRDAHPSIYDATARGHYQLVAHAFALSLGYSF